MKIIHDPAQGKFAIPMGWVYNENGECSPHKMTKEQFLDYVSLRPQSKWVFSDRKLTNDEIMLEFQ